MIINARIESNENLQILNSLIQIDSNNINNILERRDFICELKVIISIINKNICIYIVIIYANLFSY